MKVTVTEYLGISWTNVRKLYPTSDNDRKFRQVLDVFEPLCRFYDWFQISWHVRKFDVQLYVYGCFLDTLRQRRERDEKEKVAEKCYSVCVSVNDTCIENRIRI